MNEPPFIPHDPRYGWNGTASNRKSARQARGQVDAPKRTRAPKNLGVGGSTPGAPTLTSTPSINEVITWKQEFKTLFTWVNAAAFAVCFGLAAIATIFAVESGSSPWALVAFPLPVMLFSVWLVLQGIWIRPDRIHLGKRLTWAAFVAPTVFLALQALLAIALGGSSQNISQAIPFSLEPGAFIFVGIFFTAAATYATALVSIPTTAILRAFTRRSKLAQTTPRQTRCGTAIIGIGLVPFLAGWAIKTYFFDNVFGGVSWRMVRDMISSAPPGMPGVGGLSALVAIAFGVLGIGVIMLIIGVLLLVWVFARPFLQTLIPALAHKPTAAADVVASDSAAPAPPAPPNAVPVGFVGNDPNVPPRPDSPLGEYLARVQYDGDATLEQ